MPALFNFDGPYLKAERAKHHIDQIKSIFAAHVAANEDAFRAKDHGEARQAELRVGTPLPKHTPTILGDALHNLRATLDHAYCVLVEENGCDLASHPKASKVKFPFTANGTRRDLEGSINGHVKLGIAPRQAVIDHIFDVVQPYPGGHGEDLLAVHILDIADKHMTILPVDHEVHVERIETENGSVIQGITFGRVVPPAATVTGSAIFVSADTFLKKDANNKITLQMGFGRGQPFEGRPVIPILDKMMGRVMQTLKELETFLT
jgi:hypothetical protein